MRTFRAPGRVNLIGEHTDYAGGLVLPAAIDRYVTVSGEPGGDTVTLTSEGLGTVNVPARGESTPEVTGWGRYVAAVVAEIATIGRPPIGFSGRINSDLPAGAGLGSSAALEVAIAIALCAVADFEPDPMELVHAAQRAEHKAVGVPCGIMDQAASTLGRRDHALFLNCRTLEHYQVVLPADVVFVVIDSGIQRNLEDTRYALRRQELQDGMPKRVHHFVSENERVAATVAELKKAGGPDPSGLQRIFAAGHASLREDFEVSTKELDLLVELTLQAGAIAARMTGAGFGGSILALADAGDAHAIADEVLSAYDATGRSGRAFVCRAADGAGELLGS